MTGNGKALLKLIAGLGVALVPAPLVAQFPANDVERACTVGQMKDSVKVGKFLFRSYRNLESGESCLRVLAGQRIIFQRTNDNGGRFQMGQAADKEFGIPAIPNGTDITGRGRPNMIVSAYSGVAHCCLQHYIFELEPTFRLLATVNDMDDDAAHFERDGDRYYLHTADWTFAYWWQSFAGSPNHSVVLRYVDDEKVGGFHLAMDKMRTPTPTPEEWQKAVGSVRHELALGQRKMANDLPDILWQEVLNLIYTDHSELAWKFIDEVSPLAQQGTYPNLADFCGRLKKSPYWLDLEATLRNTPAACANAKPSKR
ncbi:MAG: hypothetical protein KGL64_11195 [Acidobacteriota bacterium]|nr:hypothetical protein [Acidobacteriota bacterium]